MRIPSCCRRVRLSLKLYCFTVWNLIPAENDNSDAARGGYGRFPTMGGFDQMTAQLGGFWDSMLAEGRHWWITANSDSHRHWREGGSDFWPGEYSKTYIKAQKTDCMILESELASSDIGQEKSPFLIDIKTN